jgi:general stress protein 26
MDYDEAIAKVGKLFAATKFAVLATANRDGVVSASQMCLVNDGMTLYFQTDSSFEKIRNIRENPHVAVNVGACYCKGTAELLGHPAEFPDFIEKIRRKHPETYESYTNIPTEILVKVEVSECKIWGADAGKSVHSQSTIKVLDLVKKTSTILACGKM